MPSAAEIELQRDFDFAAWSALLYIARSTSTLTFTIISPRCEMSGLEVIAAITSILALVEFSQKVLVRAAQLRAGRKDIGDAFQCINDLLLPINQAVKRTKERIDKKEIDEDTCIALVPIHRGVERTLEELSNVLKKYTPEDGASRAEVLWKAGKGVFQEKKVKGILQRLHEYVGVLTLSHAEAANAQSFSSTEKEDIRRILANVARSNTTQAASLPRKCHNLLSLDGGGLRGLSILYILRDLMAKVNEHQDPPLKPCEVFDLIGGSGTGG
jgi:N-terminal domain on NACHT_NTPase and P-loop NTPases